MQTQIKMHKLGRCFLLWFLCTACDGNRVFDAYQSIENGQWGKDELVSFEFEIRDTLVENDLYIQIRNTEAFAFNNLFIIASLQFPNGEQSIDTLEYKMTDRFGNWLGNGFTDIKENKLYYKESFVFPVTGNYTIHFEQAMRKRNQVEGIEFLEGISDVGFRIEKK